MIYSWYGAQRDSRTIDSARKKNNLGQLKSKLFLFCIVNENGSSTETDQVMFITWSVYHNESVT